MLGDCCFEEKKRTGKTLQYFVMQHGGHRYPNRSYNYAAFCDFRGVDIKPGSIWGHLSNTFLGKQTNDLFTVHIIVIPLNCHCVGEGNGCKKLDKIQEQCYRKASYGTCDSCLAVWSYHTGSTNANGGGWCTPQIYFHLARGKNCFDDWLLGRHWPFLISRFSWKCGNVTEINQVSFLATTRLESRVAKTTAMITVAIVLSFVPFTSTAILVNIFPAFRTYPVYRFAETVVQFNSLVSPIMYSYRDKRFRNAILELLGVKKSQQRLDGRRNLRERESIGLANLAEQTQGTLAPLSKRSASVEPARNPKMQVKRSLSDPTPTKCDKTCSAQPSKFKLQQRATVSMTSTAIHHQRSKSHGRRKNSKENSCCSVNSQTSVVSPKGMVNPNRVLSPKSWDNRAKGNISNSQQKRQLNETTRRPKTAPSNLIHSNEKSAPTPTKCDKTCSAQPSKLELQQRATISMTSTAIHHQRSKSHGTRNSQRRINAALSIARQTSVVSPKGMVNPSRVLSSKSRVKRAKGNISNSRQKSQLKETTRRPKTVPSNVIHPNEKSTQHKVSKKSVINYSECPFWSNKLLTRQKH